MGSLTPLPFWQINVPPTQRTPTCPPFLLALTPKDHGIISTPDSAYRTLTWPEAQSLIARNRIDLFQRVPSQLRRYLEHNHLLAQRHGSVMQFVLAERLRWTLPLHPEGDGPFARDADVKVLCNDWPYGIDPAIVHLVVWTKFELEDDPATGELTEAAREAIEAYVSRTFRARVGSERVVWFKNWRSLKSVRSVEHFHVMLYDPDPAFIDEVTDGDVPLSKKV